MAYDLTISGNSCSVQCHTSRYDVSDYLVTVETWVKKSDYIDLRNSVRPGAIGSYKYLLGRDKYYDATWTGKNTICLTPAGSKRLHNLRTTKCIFVKNISSVPVHGPSTYINIKIEGMLSGMADL